MQQYKKIVRCFFAAGTLFFSFNLNNTNTYNQNLNFSKFDCKTFFPKNPYKVTSPQTNQSINPSNVNWTSCLNDNLKICEILIPGAHDCGSYSMSPKINTDIVGKAAQTQDVNVYDQLKLGIRSLDLRSRMFNKKSVINHGPVMGCETLEVLDDILKFSTEHPSEIIGISMIQCTKESMNYLIKTDTMKRITEKSLTKSQCKELNKPLGQITLGDLRKNKVNFIILSDYEKDCFHSSSELQNIFNPITRNSYTPIMVNEEINNLKIFSSDKLRNISPLKTANTKDFFLNQASPMDSEYQYSNIRNALLSESDIFKEKANIVSLDAVYHNREFINFLIDLNFIRSFKQ